MEARIKFNQLYKQYMLGTHVGGKRSLYQYLFDIVKLKTPREKKTFYSLKNVNLTILSGETVGIVGTNGSGKSTLLRVISGITAPTSGECLTRGRVASLLEVGAGFYPELTGRENVYIVGAIMGMRRVDIDRQYEEIIELSGLTTAHLDTPVMRYSSGQYMRLAFSISVHVNADIVLVDEILAVGDKKFQRLAISELSRIAKSGKTVIFVSHQHHLIADLCERIIWMKDGCVVADGPSKEVMRAYLAPEIVVNEKAHNLNLLPIMGANAFRDIESNIEYHRYYSILESKETGVSFTLKVSLLKTENWFGELIIDCCYYNDVTSASDIRYTTCVPNMLPSGNYRLVFVCEVRGKPVAATQKEFTVDGKDNLDSNSQDQQAILKDFLLVGRGNHNVS